MASPSPIARGLLVLTVGAGHMPFGVAKPGYTQHRVGVGRHQGRSARIYAGHSSSVANLPGTNVDGLSPQTGRCSPTRDARIAPVKIV